MQELETTAALLYYAYIAFGSISAGYLLLRFTYPEIRVFSQAEKLGASALAGLLIALAAIGADIATSGVKTVLSAKGNTLFFWTAAFGALFCVLKVGLREKHKEVAIPVTSKLKTLQQELNDLQEKPPEKQSEVSKKLDELRKKGIIPRTGGEEIVSKIVPQPIPAGAGEKPVGVQAIGKLEQNVSEVKKVIEKAKEAEIEAIIADLNEQVEGAPQRRHVRPREPVKGLLEEAAGTMQPTAAQPPAEKEEKPVEPAAGAVRPRRLYMQKKEEAKEGEKKEAEAQPQQPQIRRYAQRQPEKKEEKKAEAKKEAAATQPLTMEDLFGAAPAQKEVSMVQSQKAPEFCPNCNAKNSRIVFCPYCGTGMCANCSPGVMPSPEGFTYQCPKCGEDVPVKKRVQAT